MSFYYLPILSQPSFPRLFYNDSFNIFHISVPSAPPPDVLAVNTSSTSLLIEWDPLLPAQTHGILRGYVVFYKRRAYRNRPWVLRRTTPTTRAVEIFGLRKFTKYNIQVAGFTSKGIGRRSKLFFVPTGEDSKYGFDIRLFPQNYSFLL